MKIYLSPGERNPIEGKFGQGKVAFGVNKIKTKLPSKSNSWIAAIALVLNLVKLNRQALVSQIFFLESILESYLDGILIYVSIII